MGSSRQYVDCTHFAGDVADVAHDLVGRTLSVSMVDSTYDAMIVETEAYGGPSDLASHAAFKPKGGARIMWESPGTIYVFLAYGMYPCLNIVSEQRDTPGAVLIRGVWRNVDEKATLGPGRVGRLLGVTLADNGQQCCGPKFNVSHGKHSLAIEATPRVGITRGIDTLWRFNARLD